MDSFEALGDHRAHAQEQRTFGRPVTRRPRPIFLAREDDQRHALGLIALRGFEDRHFAAVREVASPVAPAPRHLLAQPHAAGTSAAIDSQCSSPWKMREYSRLNFSCLTHS